MAGVSGGALAAAVSRAGGLGCVAAGSTTPVDWLADQVAVASGLPLGVGLLAWALPGRPDLVEAALAARPALVSMSYGPYEQHVSRFRDAGVVVATQAGTVAEAVAAERAGVDVVVARGGEGGGHGRDEVATLPLLQGVLDAVSVPVLAAGGIGTARGLAAVLAAGAAGVWVGTAFLACPEAETSPQARERLLAADSTATAYGRVFDVGLRQAWPREYGGRALRNAFFDRWQGREDELAEDDAAAEQLRAAGRTRDLDTSYVYAGQSVGLLTQARPAADVVAELARGRDLLRAAAASV
jgi:nitronate monooxygenase